jgi:GAF domain-containing protein
MQPIKVKAAALLSTSLPESLLSQLDRETQRLARLLNTLLNLLLIITLLVFVNVFFSPNPVVDAITAFLLLDFVLISRWLLLRGQVRVSATVLTAGLWLTLVAATFVSQMEGNGPFIGLILVIIVAGLLLGSTAGFLVALLSSVAGMTYLAITLSQSGMLPMLVPYSAVGFMVTMVILFFAIAGLIHLAYTSLNEAVQAAYQNEQAMAESNLELEKMRRSLEEQVAVRTRILEQRTHYLQAAVEVSRATASILDNQRLIQTAVDLIREQFDLYYVGLFQMDPTGEWAVLQAGTGEAGAAMIARDHRIAYGRGMIGWSVANAQPRVAGQAGEDAVRLATPELPETRSEAAIPLRSRGRVLGALTVQSDRPDAFADIEIATFQALADQLAIALDNARLITESQQAVEEAQRAYGWISRRAWSEYIHTTSGQTSTQWLPGGDGSGSQNLPSRYRLGPQANEANTGALAGPAALASLEPVRQEVLQSGRPSQCHVAGRPALLLPIQVRDQVIGVITLIKNQSSAQVSSARSASLQPKDRSTHNLTPAWNTEEVELLKTIVEQLGVALDSARLYADTLQRAEQERLVDRVTSQMRATLDLETVLETATREMRDALGLAEVEVRLGDGSAGGGYTDRAHPAGENENDR